MKDEQKYFSEVGLLQATKGVALLKPAELDLIADSPSHLKEIEESHIYFVCQRAGGPWFLISTASATKWVGGWPMVFDLDSISNKMGAPSFAAVCEGRVPGALAVTACAAPNIPSEAEQLPTTSAHCALRNPKSGIEKYMHWELL